MADKKNKKELAVAKIKKEIADEKKIKEVGVLHTNIYKKILFIMVASASTLFNILLFSSISSNFFMKIIWGLVGAAAVIFQTIELREFYNCKKKKKFNHLILYLIFSIGSMAGTLGAGIAQIEKTKLKNIKQTTKIEIIDKRIIDIESTNKNASEKAINNIILKTNINQWALLSLLDKKEKLNKQQINEYNELEILKIERATILKTQNSILSSLSGLSKLFDTDELKIAFIFLMFITLSLEIMLYRSATFKGKLLTKIKTKNKKLSKIDKQKKVGQLFLEKTKKTK